MEMSPTLDSALPSDICLSCQMWLPVLAGLGKMAKLRCLLCDKRYEVDQDGAVTWTPLDLMPAVPPMPLAP